MKRLTTLAMISGLWLIWLLGCNAPENKNLSKPLMPAPSSSSASPNPTSEIDRVFDVPSVFKPIYKILKVEDVSTQTASRKVVNVSLPKGTNKKDVENNLRYAAKELYEKEKPDAIEVRSYLEGRTIDASNALGSLIFAPFGDWARASEKPSLDSYRVVFQGRNSYQPPINEESLSANNSLERQALAGDYQAQRNLAYSLSTGAEGYPTNPVMACVWRIVILKSGHAEADASDTGNKTFDCEQKLNSQQLRDAGAQANALLKRIKKRK